MHVVCGSSGVIALLRARHVGEIESGREDSATSRQNDRSAVWIRTEHREHRVTSGQRLGSCIQLFWSVKRYMYDSLSWYADIKRREHVICSRTVFVREWVLPYQAPTCTGMWGRE